MTPTPTAPDRTVTGGETSTLSEALDAAARGPTGINLHSPRGQLIEVLPYAALREQALAVAGRLRAAGLGKGDRVGLAAESSGDFLRAFFACQYAGLVPVPTPLPAPFGGKEVYVEHIRRMLISADVRAAFAPPELAAWFAEAGEGLALVAAGSLDSLPDAGALEPVPAAADDLCYLQYSSGSTRFPVGVAVTQRALMANIAAIGGPEGLAVGPADRAVSWLPLYHDMGLVGMLLTGLTFQVSIDLLPTTAFVRRPGLWLDLLGRGGTISYAPTFGYDLAARRAGAAGGQTLDLSSWRIAGVGGDMIRPGPLRAFAEAYGEAGFDQRAFVASYGMAEATLALSLSPIGQGLKTDGADVAELERQGLAAPAKGESRAREFALCGKVLPGHRLEVRGETGEVLPARRVGRIFAAGPSLMRAYFNAPEETSQVLGADGWLDTGDLGYFLGEEIVITGRAKDLIIVNGRNVWPQDLEWTAERQIEGLRSGDVAAFQVTEAAGERVIALVQCRTREPERRQALKDAAAGVLRVTHGLDVEVVLAPPHSLPQTSSGKLSRSRARSLYLSGAFEEAAQPVGA
ncbi:MAG TPA: fatty acyl-AMP ligase [Methylosinus sp.]|uniref:fatty acyl-AMP ligase n=1 Tax=Methylosinus sp. TaxID=427 RepID=UPI002F945EF4|nr:fatty acyl-AMP ligase [Caulobacteraceae bacterium]